MNQSDKGLLLVDLCSRYPYGIIVRLDLVDNWGPGGGKFILVKRLYFNVGDLKK